MKGAYLRSCFTAWTRQYMAISSASSLLCTAVLFVSGACLLAADVSVSALCSQTGFHDCSLRSADTTPPFVALVGAHECC